MFISFPTSLVGKGIIPQKLKNLKIAAESSQDTRETCTRTDVSIRYEEGSTTTLLLLPLLLLVMCPFCAKTVMSFKLAKYCVSTGITRTSLSKCVHHLLRNSIGNSDSIPLSRPHLKSRVGGCSTRVFRVFGGSLVNWTMDYSSF